MSAGKERIVRHVRAGRVHSARWTPAPGAAEILSRTKVDGVWYAGLRDGRVVVDPSPPGRWEWMGCRFEWVTL